MAFVIIKTYLQRIQKMDRVAIKQQIFDKMIQYHLVRDRLQPEMHLLEQHERPPMIEVSEYLEKFQVRKSS